ncbi:permease [Candidatus Woesearchaeota archaeon]|nr:permease [Candidatus Woesearchaeota archaeon]
MSEEHIGNHCSHCEPTGPKISDKLAYSLTGLALLLAASALVPALHGLFRNLMDYLGLIWWAILLGFLLGGVIDYFVPDAFIQAQLSTARKGSLWRAALAGFLLSACSHGVLALAIQLYKKGAGIPNVITFLLASPWANLPVTILLIGFFGWQAFLFIGAAIVVALITGSVYQLLEKRGLVETSPAPVETEVRWRKKSQLTWKDSAKGVARGALSLANMVLWWIVIGVVAAGALRTFVPQEAFMQYFGPGIAGLLLTLLFATIIEVCSEGSAPLALEIFNKTGALGNPFVFLMAGVATDYTEIGLLWSNIGRRTALWLPAVTVPQIVLLGIAFNAFL